MVERAWDGYENGLQLLHAAVTPLHSPPTPPPRPALSCIVLATTSPRVRPDRELFPEFAREAGQQHLAGSLSSAADAGNAAAGPRERDCARRRGGPRAGGRGSSGGRETQRGGGALARRECCTVNLKVPSSHPADACQAWQCSASPSVCLTGTLCVCGSQNDHKAFTAREGANAARRQHVASAQQALSLPHSPAPPGFCFPTDSATVRGPQTRTVPSRQMHWWWSASVCRTGH